MKFTNNSLMCMQLSKHVRLSVLQSDNPLSSTWGLTGTLFGLNRGKVIKRRTLGSHDSILNNYFSCVSFASIFIICNIHCILYYNSYMIYIIRNPILWLGISAYGVRVFVSLFFERRCSPYYFFCNVNKMVAWIPDNKKR